MKRYNPKEIEPRWQRHWQESKIYEASDTSDKPKKYIMEYFPYPSGAAMHVGHVRNYTIGDAISRYNRMRGYNVLHPMGWDAFGLPAENYAIKTGISPQEAIKQNTAKFKRQLTQMGFSYDWSREINSSDPAYYKWTQWFFLLLFKRGLAYQKESLQWWCPIDKTVLANEQVEEGKCWRCGSGVEKKALKQWFFKITDYADRLEKDLDDVNWSDGIKNMQRNWIGHKTGINITYHVSNAKTDENITVFTTRPDTNYGATFVVLAPEHPFVQKVMNQEIVPKEGSSHWQAVQHYVQKALAKSDVERQEEGRLKTGAFTGLYVTNPLNGRELPVWVSDFVLAGFGTGAVVGVPGHDMRDFEFAKEFSIPIERVVVGPDGDTSPIERREQVQERAGKMINSGPLDGLNIRDAIEKMKDLMEEKGMGSRTHTYRIRDWLISRQRYWGAPIPIIHCEKDGAVPVPDDQLPVVLPEMKSYEPRKSTTGLAVDASEASQANAAGPAPYAPAGDGYSPLARVPEWVNTTCPTCGGPAVRETDTMDGFACSSWYFLRFADPHNSEKAFDADKVRYWLPVDDYIGGAEHAVMHLLYARMWTKVMQDAGLIDFGEPFKTLRNHGMILAPDGQKMSKSKGNTIEPDGLIEQGYGADAIRIMELFVGPWNQVANWSVEGMGGSFRFLQRVWALSQDVAAVGDGPDTADAVEITRIMHRTIKKVGDDLENLGFNTAIAAMMEAINGLYAAKTTVPLADAPQTWHWAMETFQQLLAPFAPHITEELWHELGHQTSVHTSEWPAYDEHYLVSDTVTIAVQVNGKIRGEIEIATTSSEADIIAAAKAHQKVAAHLAGREVKKTIYVPAKLVSFVVV
ncbi:MAG TPA: leucine--tRNA ligase [Candidatus Saccharimonadales bacterium]|nr:leucine--tRNA ligase [Candidatus Saccharimonadales bacterium]